MVIYIGLMALAMPILWAGKRFITLPRMGHVKFGPKGKARRNRASRVITMLVLVGAVVFVFTSLALKGDWSEGLPLQLILPAAWASEYVSPFQPGGLLPGLRAPVPGRRAVCATGAARLLGEADLIFLMRQTGLTWGNLSSHMSKLEQAGYIEVEKEFKGKKPHTMRYLTQEGWDAFQAYRQRRKQVTGELPY